MTLAAFLSAGLGYVAGLVAAFYLARPTVRSVMRDPAFSPGQRRTVARVALAGGLVALVPALLLGTVVGATLGGFSGAALADSSGASESGVVFGIAAGVFAVVVPIVWISAAMGAWLGRSMARDAA
jgi:hypothetical protein